MATPFSWESRPTTIRENSTRKVSNKIKSAVDTVFEGTFNPEINRRDWFDFLSDPSRAYLLGFLGITSESDLSYMLPPIADIDLPLLDKLRHTLSDLNKDACCYPYSAKSASDIKRLVNLMSDVKIKADICNRNKMRIYIDLKSLEGKRLKIKQLLLDTLSVTVSIREDYINKLSDVLLQIRRLRKSEAKAIEECLKAERFNQLINDKIKNIFFAKDNWKFHGIRQHGSNQYNSATTEPDTEFFHDKTNTSLVSHITIVEAIQEATEHLVSSRPDVHPVPWKNVLIIPDSIQFNNLETDWATKYSGKFPNGEAENIIKLPSNSNSAGLVATWEQYATWGVKGFQNPLQAALSSQHDVKLFARVTIGFNNAGTIVPNIPWWDNTMTNSTVGQQINDFVLQSPVNYFYSPTNVGFVWEYKRPSHPRATIRDTPWQMAMEPATSSTEKPSKKMNLPRGTSVYAVRLSFIKVDGSVVPISNTILGSDVDRHFKSKIQRELRQFNNSTFKVHPCDVDRLTQLARSVLGVTEEQRLRPLQADLRQKRLLHTNAQKETARWENAYDALNTIKAILEQILDELYAGADPADKAAFDTFKLNPSGNLRFSSPGTQKIQYAAVNPVVSDTDAQTGIVLDMRTWVKKIRDETVINSATNTRLQAMEKTYEFIFNNLRRAAPGTPPLATDKISPIYREMGLATEAQNRIYDIVVAAEQKVIDIQAGGNLTHGLTTPNVSGYYERDVIAKQCRSFTENNRWNPWTDDLPDNFCLFLEPGLRRYSNDDRLARMNQGVLRASSWNLGSNVVDVDGEENSFDSANYVSYAEWLERQKIVSASFSLRVVTGKNNQLTDAEQLIRNFKDTNLEFRESLQIRQIRLRDKWKQLENRKNQLKSDEKAARTVLNAEIEDARKAAENYLNASMAAAAKDAGLEAIKTTLNQKYIELVDIGKKLISVNEKKALAIQRQGVLSGSSNALQPAEQAELDILNGGGPGSIQVMTAQYVALEAAQVLKKAEVDKESANYDSQSKTFRDNFTDVLNARVADLEQERKNADAALAIKVRVVEKEQRDSIEKLRERMNLLLSLTNKSGGGLNFRERVERGNITIDRENETEKNKTNTEYEFSAPGDMRYGGGSFWKYSAGIKSLPYASYLLYDKQGRGFNGGGDRYKRVWSGLGTDKKVGTSLDKYIVYTINGMNEIPASVDNLVPVYDERTIVNFYEKSGQLTNDAQHSPFRLYKAPTTDEDWSNRDLCYMARGNEIGTTPTGENTYDAFFYDLPLKPGTFVNFYIKSSDGTDDGARERMKIASRLQEYNTTPDTNYPVEKSYVDPALFNAGIGLTGHIENIHMVNLNTTISEIEIEQLKTDVKDAEVILDTAKKPGTGVPLIMSVVNNAQDQLNLAVKTLKEAKEKSGKFDYGEALKIIKSGGDVTDMFQSVLVADIRVTGNFVVKNVLYANLVEMSTYGSDGISDVICKTAAGNEGGTTSKKSTTTDRRIYVKLANSGTHKLVPIETVKPIFEVGSNVLYENFVTRKLEVGRIVTSPVIRLSGIQSSYKYLIQPDSGTSRVNVLHSNVALLLDGADTLQNISDDPSLTLSGGYNQLNYLPLYNSFSPTDLDADSDRVVAHMSVYLKKYYDDNSYGNRFTANAKAIYVGGSIKGKQLRKDRDILSKMAIILPAENFSLVKVPSDQMQNKATIQALSNIMNVNPVALVEDMFSSGKRCILVDLYSVYDGVDPTLGLGTMNVLDIDGKVHAPTEHFLSVGFDPGDGTGYEIQNLYLKDFTVPVKFRLPQLILEPGRFDKDAKGYRKLLNPTGGPAYAIVGIDGNVVDNGFKPPINIENANVEHLLSTKLSQPAFVLTTGTEGDSETLADEDEKGWESSWKRTEDEVAKWASSTSDSDGLMLVSDKETNAVPAWVSSSSSDVESVKGSVEAAWASSSSLSKQSGGFASSTSDDDADNLAAIISKIDRIPIQASAAWAEDSESDE